MPTPPDFKALPNLPGYLWNEKAAQYVSIATGRFVSRNVIRGQLDKVIDASSKTMKALSQQLRDGKINLAQWQAGMMQQIKTTHLAGAAMQRGGWQQMTQSDFGRVGQIVREEYKYLRQFADDIASGKVPLDGNVGRRAALYGQQGRPTYLQFWDLEAAKRGFNQEKSTLNPAEHCSECVIQAAMGWQPMGQMIPIGARRCRSNDRCSKWYRNSATDETIQV